MLTSNDLNVATAFYKGNSLASIEHVIIKQSLCCMWTSCDAKQLVRWSVDFFPQCCWNWPDAEVNDTCVYAWCYKKESHEPTWRIVLTEKKGGGSIKRWGCFAAAGPRRKREFSDRITSGWLSTSWTWRSQTRLDSFNEAQRNLSFYNWHITIKAIFLRILNAALRVYSPDWAAAPLRPQTLKLQNSLLGYKSNIIM